MKVAPYNRSGMYLRDGESMSQVETAIHVRVREGHKVLITFTKLELLFLERV